MEALAPRSSISIPRPSPQCRSGARPHPFARRSLAVFRRLGSSPLLARPTIRSSPALAPSQSCANGSTPSPSESDFVEVIGIGSRKDSIIDYCSNSPSLSSYRLRFWTIQTRDSLKVQLLQRRPGADALMRDLEFLLSLHPHPPAFIIVASSGLGLDHITAMELLNDVKSAGSLAVAVILKPFSFEGPKRQEEVENLVNKLKDGLHFQIVVEADSLLKKELETFAEALETVNNAVVLAIKSIYAMVAATCLKIQSPVDGQIKKLEATEAVKLLQKYGEGQVGFGAGSDIKSAVRQAVSCLFLNNSIKELNGLVIFTLMSASDVNESKLLSAILGFRQISECRTDIIFSGIQEPHLEPNSVVITLLILGCNRNIVLQKESFLSGLARHFRFLSTLMGMDISEKDGNVAIHSFAPKRASSPSDIETISKSNAINLSLGSSSSPTERDENQVSPIETTFEDKSGLESSENTYEYFNENNADISQLPGSRNVPLDLRNIGPDLNVVPPWGKEYASLNAASRNDEVENFSLPVGVKPCTSVSAHSSQPNDVLPDNSHDSNLSKTSLGNHDFASRDAGGLGAVLEICNSALSLVRGRNSNESRNGVLSARAVSMLEAERESEKRWAPVTEIQYKGGTYKGRCQGGLPEGKVVSQKTEEKLSQGRLTFPDGSYYDGIWRIGKRCGLGTLCYRNGDVFQGSWRDDLMHGKGWLYFQSGDRWFANFWKGKANGEGRFYSRNGSIFIGHFKNSWRHGQSLFIDTDGSRWREQWDDGILVSRTQINTEA